MFYTGSLLLNRLPWQNILKALWRFNRNSGLQLRIILTHRPPQHLTVLPLMGNQNGAATSAVPSSKLLGRFSLWQSL